jgi:hypothetical protein
MADTVSRQTALKTLHVFHRLMRECDANLLQLVRACCLDMISLPGSSGSAGTAAVPAWPSCTSEHGGELACM